MSVSRASGFTIVELMITIAILSIVAAIAIPAYNGYIREGHHAAMRSTMSSLRTQIEDFALDRSTYVGVATSLDLANINLGPYNYTVSPTTQSYAIWGRFDGNPDLWTRCEERMNLCCDSPPPPNDPGDPTAACPSP